MYLVDTNVLSAGASTKAVAAPELVAWMDRNGAGLYLSVITVAEVEDGIARSRRLGVPRKAERLSEWLGTLLHLYGLRVLPIDVETARRVGALADRARSRGLAPGLADLAIAATAQRYGYTVLTRNLRHFGSVGAPALDPGRRCRPGLRERSDVRRHTLGRPLHGDCKGVPFVDRFSVWRDGAHAIWLRDGGTRVMSDRKWRGEQSWVPGHVQQQRPALPMAPAEALPDE